MAFFKKTQTQNTQSIGDTEAIPERKIYATWGMFLGLSKEISTHAFAISEFIDNSISSWQKTHDSLDGLKINIMVIRDDLEQELEIRDNAGGMTPTELSKSIELDDTANKKSTDLNQYGYGMKLGIFYFGCGFEIYTKTLTTPEVYVSVMVDTPEKKSSEAVVKILNSTKNVIYTQSGTVIKIKKIHAERQFDCAEKCDRLRDALAIRYSGAIEKGLSLKMTIYNNQKPSANQMWEIRDFKIPRYNLNDVVNYYRNDPKLVFDKEEYLTKYKNEIMKLSDEKIKRFTDGKSFNETLLSGEDMFFEYDAIINDKPVKVKWGIIAMKELRNTKYGYEELWGFKLTHNCRAIIHGPNDKTSKKAGSIQALSMKSYSIPLSQSGGISTFIRIFGEIDLTGIEEPDRNKRTFLWSVAGRFDLDKTLGDLWVEIRDHINLIKDLEKEPKQHKIANIVNGSGPDNKKITANEVMKALMGERIVEQQNSDDGKQYVATIKVAILTAEHKKVKFILDYNQDEKMSMPFRFKSEEKNFEKIRISVNINHILFGELYKKNDGGKSRAIANTLAIALSICTIRYDHIANSGYYTNQNTNENDEILNDLSFDETFNEVLYQLLNNNAN